MVKRWFFALILCVFAWPLQAQESMQLTLIPETRPYPPIVGEMIFLTIRAVYNRKVAVEKLEIAPTDAFDWIQTRPDNWREERIDGALRIVMERQLAIWPKRAGLLQFGPVTHRMTIIDENSQRKDITVTGKPVALSIGEFPEQHGWHFTARALELTDELSANPARLADGQILTRKVTLRALGALPEHLPPRPVVQEDWLISFTLPIERNLLLTEDGPVAELVWGWQFRPHTGEPGVLEPVSIGWFDTSQHKLQKIDVPTLTIGLASFYTGQVPSGRLGAWQLLALAGALFAGFALAIGFALWRLTPRADWRRVLDHYSPRLRLRYLQARRRGDLITQRTLAEKIGRPAPELRALEEQIYGRPRGAA